MAPGSIGDDRRWAADRREFVADSRDDAADRRDAIADAREDEADRRQAEQDLRDRELHALAESLGAVAPASSVGAGAAERAARASAAEQALLSRDVIGQAKGILMERLRATPEEAFEILRRSSTRLNVKLREVALQLTETGEVDAKDVTTDVG